MTHKTTKNLYILFVVLSALGVFEIATKQIKMIEGLDSGILSLWIGIGAGRLFSSAEIAGTIATVFSIIFDFALFWIILAFVFKRKINAFQKPLQKSSAKEVLNLSRIKQGETKTAPLSSVTTPANTGKLTKLDKAVKISIIVGTLIVALSVFYYLIILHQRKTINPEDQVKEDFTKVMDLRIIGNCDSFADSVSKSSPRVSEYWGNMCKRDNNLNQPIRDFSIKKVIMNGDNAFLQVELIRSYAGKDERYIVQYKLTKYTNDGEWKLLIPEEEK